MMRGRTEKDTYTRDRGRRKRESSLVWRVQKEGNTKENTSFFKH